MKLSLTSKPFKDISYIRVLQYAANRAVGLGLSSESNDGFTLAEIEADDNCKGIDPSWLKEILQSICTIRKGATEVGETEIKDNDWDEYKFTIKSEEFIKLATLISVKKTHTSLMVAIFAIMLSIIVPPLTVIYLTTSVDIKNISLDSKSISKIAVDIKKSIIADEKGEEECPPK